MMNDYIGHRVHSRKPSLKNTVFQVCVLSATVLVLLWVAFLLGHISTPELITDRNLRRAFSQIVHKSYTLSSNRESTERRPFNLSEWKVNGDLRDGDRILLAEIYGKANSVFEFGLGESSLLANYLGVPRYVGLDSDPSYIAIVREKVASHYRFTWADIGKIDAKGRPGDKLLPKHVYSYQIAPLITEYEAFDVYMVNGSWRLPSILVAFLHATAGKVESNFHAEEVPPVHQTFDTHTTVVLHDCFQKEKAAAVNHLLDLVNHSGQSMCVYRRKATTSDQDLLNMWMNKYNEVG